MKLHSYTGLITNSSTELYLIKGTDEETINKFLAKFFDILNEFSTKGFEKDFVEIKALLNERDLQRFKNRLGTNDYGRVVAQGVIQPYNQECKLAVTLGAVDAKEGRPIKDPAELADIIHKKIGV